MWIVFEGLDKSGKGTLEWEVLKATNFKHIVIDRGPAGYIAFDTIFGRRTYEGDIQQSRCAATVDKADFLIVYCKVPVDVAMQRLKEHNEECPYDYSDAQEIYDSCIDFVYTEETKRNKLIVIDTTKSIAECVKIIIQKLKEV